MFQFLFQRGLILALVICLFSCSAPKPLEYRNCKNLVIGKISVDSSTLSMDVVYYNPNNYGMKLKRADLDLFIDSSFIGHVAQDYEITIPKKSEFSVPLKLNVDMQNVFKNALLVFFSHQADIRASGSIKLGKAFLFFKVPVNYESVQHFDFN
jgi:LEA14-like dessication related protein